MKAFLKKTSKYLKTFRSSRPLLFIILVAIGVVVLMGGSAYAIYSSVQRTETSTTSESENDSELPTNQETSKPSETIPVGDIEPATTNTPNVTKNDDNSKKNTPSSTSNSGSKPSPFTINTTKSVSIVAGSSAGPFVASTSDGSKVMWTTPSNEKSGSPYGYTTNGTGRTASSSYEYFIRSEDATKPGTYTLSFSGVATGSQVRAFASITVIINARPYFSITTGQSTYEVNENQRVLRVPYTITRYNGHANPIKLVGTIDKAPGPHYISSIPINEFSSNSGEIVFDTSGGGVPEGPYSVKVYARDEAGVTASAGFQVVVNWLYS